MHNDIHARVLRVQDSILHMATSEPVSIVAIQDFASKSKWHEVLAVRMVFRGFDLDIVLSDREQDVGVAAVPKLLGMRIVFARQGLDLLTIHSDQGEATYAQIGESRDFPYPCTLRQVSRYMDRLLSLTPPSRALRLMVDSLLAWKRALLHTTLEIFRK